MSSYCPLIIIPIKIKKENDEPKILHKHTMPKGGRRICLSASATVEAALVIPVFIYAVMSVMYFIQIMGAQIKIQEVLYQEARTIARYAYVYDTVSGAGSDAESDINTTGTNITTNANDAANNTTNTDQNSVFQSGISVAAAYTFFLNQLGTDNINKLHIVGGVAGLDLTGSEILQEDQKIDLVVKYRIKNPFDIFGLGVMAFTQHASTFAWTGTEQDWEAESGDADEELVYITQNGTVYHKSRECSYLKPSVSHISQYEIENARNADGEKYYPCEKCGAGDLADGAYITDYGNRYHTDPACKMIQRQILTVKKSVVPDRTPCSKCAR